MVSETAARLEYLCNTLPAVLSAIPEEQFSAKPAPGKWSKKEILGHLIDSATNNHQRFVRVQFENIPFIVYDQDNWNACSRYNSMDSKHVIRFWTVYNQHLAALIRLIPGELLSRECRTNNDKNVSLEWLISDYVQHLEYHLKQITAY